MKYIYSKKIYESTEDGKELVNIINSTPEGIDLLGLVDLYPKRGGRVYLKAKGFPGSRTFLEKKDDGNYRYGVISSGKIIAEEFDTDPVKCIRKLCIHILIKNPPKGFSKKNF